MIFIISRITIIITTITTSTIITINITITINTTTIIIAPSPPTKSLDFRGFDSSRLLILRDGNSHVRIIL